MQKTHLIGIWLSGQGRVQSWSYGQTSGRHNFDFHWVRVTWRACRCQNHPAGKGLSEERRSRILPRDALAGMVFPSLFFFFQFSLELREETPVAK